MNDVIIIGGGLSGLYTGYNILKNAKNSKVVILEKEGRFGGRVETFKNRNMSVESGAGRFHNKNKLLNELLEEFKLTDKKISIGSMKFTWNNENQEVLKLENMNKDIKHTIGESKKTTSEILRNQTFYNYIANVLGKERANEIQNHFGYSSEFTHMNAYDALVLMKDHLITNNKYFALSGGLEQIIKELTKRIKNMGGQILTRHEAEHIDYDKTTACFAIKCYNYAKIYNSRQCVCAVTSNVLGKLSIFKPVHKYTKLINELPLCRIYSKFPVKNDAWFSEIPRMTMNNKIRMLIPINPKTGIIMISYTDNNYAKYWNRLYRAKGIECVDREHKKIIDKEFGINIPTPTDTKVFYYEHGVAYFAPGFNSDIMLKKIMKPYDDIPLYACGENFSKQNNQWMEGSLDTSKYIMKYILKDINKYI